MSGADRIAARGEIGGRTVRIVETGEVECHVYPVVEVPDGHVRIKTVRSAISPGTELTFHGANAPNVYLHRHWNDQLRLFEDGPPGADYPLVLGYRAAGVVVESKSAEVPVGHRVYGNWRHTEFTTMPGEQALAQTLPDDLTWDDGVDVAQMGPIAVNAVAYAEGEHRGAPSVVFGAGPVGLLTAQVARADGAQPVYLVDRLARRLAIAESLGLVPLEAASDVDVAVTLKRRHGADGIPVAFECTGSNAALHDAIRVVKRRGAVVAVGFYQGDAIGLRLGDEFHHNSVRILPGPIGNIHPDHDWVTLRERVIELVRAGELVLGGLPRTTVPVDEIASAVKALRTRPQEILQVVLAYP